MWRPEEWKYGSDYTDVNCAAAYEFGADAILTYLLDCGIHSDGLPEPVVAVAETMPGTWVFIPDEEVMPVKKIDDDLVFPHKPGK